MQVEGDGEAKATAAGGTESHLGGDRRVGSIELPTLGHRQQTAVEAGSVSDREKLLWIGPGPVLAAQCFGDGQLHGETAVRGPAATRSPSFNHRLGCV